MDTGLSINDIRHESNIIGHVGICLFGLWTPRGETHFGLLIIKVTIGGDTTLYWHCSGGARTLLCTYTPTAM